VLAKSMLSSRTRPRSNNLLSLMFTFVRTRTPPTVAKQSKGKESKAQHIDADERGKPP
jgi:hypothetical protein